MQVPLLHRHGAGFLQVGWPKLGFLSRINRCYERDGRRGDDV
jgi:hypothetical protein